MESIATHGTGAPRWLVVVCLGMIALQAVLALQVVVTRRPERPAYEVRMTIDSLTYVRRARDMVERRDY